MPSKGLVAASSKPVILTILAGGEMYGYQIIQRVLELSGGALEWSEGLLYPLLHRMEDDSFVRSQWKKSESGRLRKYYRLTDSGRRELEKEREEWMKVHGVLSRLWALLPAPD